MAFTSRLATRTDLPALAVVIDASIEELQKGFLDAGQIRSSRAIMGIAAGFTTLELMATLAGRPLYEAAGFVPVEYTADPAGGLPVPLVRMRKPIPAPPGEHRRSRSSLAEHQPPTLPARYPRERGGLPG